ncbi:MAG: hypothetical protein LBG15_10605 [Dysgonamonadaceae bacterium]|nr:hypothetical protein [Dysgonamonadaceae bacterium]
MSDYGVYSKRAGKIRGLLQSAGVECIYVKYHGKDMHYGGWVDMGDFSARGRTKDELYALFKKCPLGKSDGGCWPCWNGQIHICARSLCGTLQGLIPSKKGVDFVDIFDETANKRDIMMNILNSDYITACDYCSGDFGTTDPAKRRKPAEQITEG